VSAGWSVPDRRPWPKALGALGKAHAVNEELASADIVVLFD
jgi:hypothetical protein